MDLKVNDNYYVQSADYLNGIDAQRIPGASLENIDGTRMVSASQMLKHANRYDGDIVTFEAEAGIKLQSLLVNIDAVQAGSGDPAPDNVRPISGWDGMTIVQTSGNIWDGWTELGAIDDSTGRDSASNTVWRSRYNLIKPSTDYFLANETADNIRYYWYEADETFISTGFVLAGGGVITAPANAFYIRIRSTGTNPTYSGGVSINYPSTLTDVLPPAASITVSWQDQAGTVYGGTLDVVTGKLTVTHLSVDASTLSWTMSSTDFWANLPLRKQGTTSAMCSHFKNRTPSTSTRIYLETDGSFADAVAFSAFLATETAAETPVLIVYELQTPIVVWIDPVSVYTYGGINIIFADTGAIADAVVPFYPLEHIWQILY